MKARRCVDTACEGPVLDDFLEEFGTGVIMSVVIVSKGTELICDLIYHCYYSLPLLVLPATTDIVEIGCSYS